MAKTNIAKKYIDLSSNVKIKFIKDRPGHDLRYALNSNKINEKLKWNSKTDLTKGLEYTFTWYSKNKSYYNSIRKKDVIIRLGTIK